MTFGVKAYFIFKQRWFSFNSSKSPKNIEKRVIYAVLEKKISIVENKDKSIKIGNLCNFREKKLLSRKRMYFFYFLPPTNENKKNH